MNYPGLLHHIRHTGKIIYPHGREVCESMKVQLEIEPGFNIYAFPKARPIEKLEAYLWEELAWYMSGDRQSAHIAKYAGLWDKIKNPDGTLNSNYGYLVFYQKTRHPSLGAVCNTGFEWAKKCLKKDKDSRQAMITYNTGGYNFDGVDDYICTQHQAFFLRDNVLRCFVALRSSDVIFGLPYNMVWWSLVHQQLLLSLQPHYPKIKIGSIEVDIYSAHIYAHHYELVDRMLSEDQERYFLRVQKQIPLGNQLDWYRDNLKNNYVYIGRSKT